MKILGIGLIGATAFALGFASAWLIYRPSDIESSISVFYGPFSQFTTSAATVLHLRANRDADAITVNCKAMRNALAALELTHDDTYSNTKARFDHMTKTGQCPK